MTLTAKQLRAHRKWRKACRSIQRKPGATAHWQFRGGGWYVARPVPIPIDVLWGDMELLATKLTATRDKVFSSILAGFGVPSELFKGAEK